MVPCATQLTQQQRKTFSMRLNEKGDWGYLNLAFHDNPQTIEELKVTITHNKLKSVIIK